jgi:hypothetical protein
MSKKTTERFAKELRATYGEDLTPVYMIISSLAFSALEYGVPAEEVGRVGVLLKLLEQ